VRRSDMLARLAQHNDIWDIVVIDGGATGVGIAVDAASRGYGVLLVATAVDQGATLVNYAPVVDVTEGLDGFVDSVVPADQEDGRQWTIAARAVINASGPFSDSVRRMAEPEAQSLSAPSQAFTWCFTSRSCRLTRRSWCRIRRTAG